MDGFAEAYELYYRKVYRFLLSLTGSQYEAEELTQEVFYRALLGISGYQDTGNMFSWLCTIGKNAWLNECRKQKRVVSLEDNADRLSGESPDPETAILRKEQRNALRKAILTLPEDYRDVIILHVYGEIPLREIAAQRGKSESWGKVTFYRAKQMLAQKMEECK